MGIAKAQGELGNLRQAKQSLERALDAPGLRSPAKDEIKEMLADISQRMVQHVDSETHDNGPAHRTGNSETISFGA